MAEHISASKYKKHNIEHHNKIARFYESRYVLPLLWRLSTNDFLQTILKSKNKGIICDLGCGTDRLRASLCDYFNYVIGIDISREMIIIAKKRKRENLDFIVADAENLPLRSCSIDVAVYYAVLHHLPDPIRCVNDLLFTLKPYGIALVAEPHIEHVLPQPILLILELIKRVLFVLARLLSVRLIKLRSRYENGTSCIAWERRGFTLKELKNIFKHWKVKYEIKLYLYPPDFNSSSKSYALIVFSINKLLEKLTKVFEALGLWKFGHQIIITATKLN